MSAKFRENNGRTSAKFVASALEDNFTITQNATNSILQYTEIETIVSTVLYCVQSIDFQNEE